MEVFIVRRGSPDSALEIDCFATREAAETWARHIGSEVEVEETLEGSLQMLMDSCEAVQS